MNQMRGDELKGINFIYKFITKVFIKNNTLDIKSENHIAYNGIKYNLETFNNDVDYGKMEHPVIKSKHYTRFSFTKDVEDIPYKNHDNFVKHLVSNQTIYSLRNIDDIVYDKMKEIDFDLSLMEFKPKKE